MCDLFTCERMLFYWRNVLHIESPTLTRERATQWVAKCFLHPVAVLKQFNCLSFLSGPVVLQTGDESCIRHRRYVSAVLMRLPEARLSARRVLGVLLRDSCISCLL